MQPPRQASQRSLPLSVSPSGSRLLKRTRSRLSLAYEIEGEFLINCLVGFSTLRKLSVVVVDDDIVVVFP